MVESTIIGLALVGWFALLALAEVFSARPSNTTHDGTDGRLLTNFGLGLLIIICTALVPVAKVGSAAWSQALGSGLGPRLALPWFALLAILFVADSLAAYWTHRLMHAAPALWRIHRVHHADSAVDVSTGLRNHPLELLVTVPVSAVLVLAIGAPPSVVVIVQTVASAATIWQHADIRLPARIERILATAIITPRLHRLHHSREQVTHDTNFGELLTIWDRMFGTFNARSDRLPVGLTGQAARSDRLIEQIWWPLKPA